MIRYRKSLLWLGIPLVLVGFVLWPFVDVTLRAPHDFRLVNVETADFEVATGPNGPVYEKVLKFDIASHSDIQTLAVRHDLFIYEVLSPCVNGKVDPEHRLWSDKHWIFDSVGAVDWWSRAPDGKSYRTIPSGPRNSHGEIRYSLFASPEFHFPPNSVHRPHDQHDPIGDQYVYDLRKSPVDLCVYVAGEGNFGLVEILPQYQFFQSNTVVIPKTLIAEIIAKAQL